MSIYVDQFLVFSLQKHRNSAKLSTQKISGESSYKRQTFTQLFEDSESHEVGNLRRGQVQPTKEVVGFAADSDVSSDGHVSSEVVVDHDIQCLDKVVVNQESGPPELVPDMSVTVAALESKPRAIQEVLGKKNADIIPKIKWGDVEDVALSLSEDCGNLSKTAKTESIDGSDNNVQEQENVAESNEPAISASSYNPLQVGEVTSEDLELFPAQLSSGDESPPDETWKEVSEIPPEGLELADVNPKDAVETIKQIPDNDSRTTEPEPDGDLCPNELITKSCLSSPVEETEILTLQEPCDKSEDGAVNVSEVSIIDDNAGMIVGPQDTNSLSHINNSVDISVDASSTETTEYPKGVQYDSTEGADLGEGEQGESKERFRERLWCFLFENLNRAVDELYLLCELECDVEQMNEAILVLEEAASDFKELKCRVQHFENAKRSTTPSFKDGLPLNIKADHRRPHALSWEVRLLQFNPVVPLLFFLLLFACVYNYNHNTKLLTLSDVLVLKTCGNCR